MALIKQSALNKGDTIRIVASSSPFEKEAFLQGVEVLKDWGFNIEYNEGIFEKIPYLAGTDERRANELIDALNDKKAKAILFARGGYGAMRLLPWLDKAELNPQPKIVLGYSDISCLQIYFYQKWRWTTLYGPVVAKDLSANTHPDTLHSLHSHLTGSDLPNTLTLNEATSLINGEITAPLVGGCLSLIVSLLGTPYELNTQGKILFLEDVNEKPYEVDRMLIQLKLAGKLTDCQGLIFGSFAGTNPDEHYIQTIQDITKEFNIPTLYGFPAGHAKRKIILPLGPTVTLNTKEKTLTYTEPLFS